MPRTRAPNTSANARTADEIPVQTIIRRLSGHLTRREVHEQNLPHIPLNHFSLPLHIYFSIVSCLSMVWIPNRYDHAHVYAKVCAEGRHQEAHHCQEDHRRGGRHLDRRLEDLRGEPGEASLCAA